MEIHTANKKKAQKAKNVKVTSRRSQAQKMRGHVFVR
jgi:hypothetical protein